MSTTRYNSGDASPVDSSQILTRDEIQSIVRAYRGRSRKVMAQPRPQAMSNWTIFRLSCCCGLRRKEIAGLNIGDLIGLDTDRPVLRVRKAVTKGSVGKRRGRLVPLWWDAATLVDLIDWRNFRLQQVKKWYDEGVREIIDRNFDDNYKRYTRVFTGEPANEPLVCVQTCVSTHRLNGIKPSSPGARLQPRDISDRWGTVLRTYLPKERAAMLTCHSGRHSYITHSLYSGRNLIQVRDAAGHSSIAMTSEYLHVLEVENLNDVFGWAEPLDNPLVARKPNGSPRMVSIELPRWTLQRVRNWAKRRDVKEDDAVGEAIIVALRVEAKKKKRRGKKPGPKKKKRPVGRPRKKPRDQPKPAARPHKEDPVTSRIDQLSSNL